MKRKIKNSTLDKNKILQKSKIVITAGGTGGHIFPAQAITEYLHKHYHIQDISLITDKKGIRFLRGIFLKIPRVVLQVVGFSGGLGNMAYAFLCMVYSFITMFFRFFKNRPLLIIGFGGYPSVPVILAGYLHRIPIIIHEQNAVIGRANSLLARFAKYVAVSFPDTKNIQHIEKNKIVFTGNLIRQNFSIKQDQSVRASKKLQILVIGGSQGSAVLSKAIPLALSKLEGDLQKMIHVKQQIRMDYIERVQELYESFEGTYETQAFFENINSLFSESDLIIARSGATTISEIIFFKKPAILIPYAAAQNNHQFVNADFLASRGAAILIEEKEIHVKLTEVINDLFRNTEKLSAISKNLSSLSYKSGDKAFAKLVVSTITLNK